MAVNAVVSLVETGSLPIEDIAKGLSVEWKEPRSPTSTPIWHNALIAYYTGDGCCYTALANHRYLLIHCWYTSGTKPHHLIRQEVPPESNDSITSLCFIPLAPDPVRRGDTSAQSCLAVGYRSGFMKVFSIHDQFTLVLLEQRLHDQPVQRIKLRTNTLSFQDSFLGDLSEDLLLLYPNIVVSIDGLALFSVLQASLLQQSGAASIASTSETLSYRKWELVGQEATTDIGSYGLVYAAALDTPHRPQGYLLSVGRNPMVAFYEPSRERTSTFSTAVAMASNVATRLTSAVFSLAKNWWSKGSSPTATAAAPAAASPKLERAVPLLPMRVLHDSTRLVTSVSTDPTGRMAALTDAFGRVTLVDTAGAVAVRMWKGYRDAQCAWVQVAEKGAAPYPTTLYFVVYAPWRGVLEVWRMRHGGRLCILDVGTGGRLLSSAAALGATKTQPLQAAFLLRPSGKIEKIEVTPQSERG